MSSKISLSISEYLEPFIRLRAIIIKSYPTIPFIFFLKTSLIILLHLFLITAFPILEDTTTSNREWGKLFFLNTIITYFPFNRSLDSFRDSISLFSVILKHNGKFSLNYKISLFITCNAYPLPSLSSSSS